MSMPGLLWPSLITGLALLVYWVFGIQVAQARHQYNVQPPKMTGPPEFERIVRVQENTLEQLMLFLPALWLFSLWLSANWAAVVGGVWLVGRLWFAWGYRQAAEKRFPGFALTSLATSVLILGAFAGMVMPFLNQGP